MNKVLIEVCVQIIGSELDGPVHLLKESPLLSRIEVFLLRGRADNLGFIFVLSLVSVVFLVRVLALLVITAFTAVIAV